LREMVSRVAEEINIYFGGSAVGHLIR
jgi:hypothetical protein